MKYEINRIMLNSFDIHIYLQWKTGSTARNQCENLWHRVLPLPVYFLFTRVNPIFN